MKRILILVVSVAICGWIATGCSEKKESAGQTGASPSPAAQNAQPATQPAAAKDMRKYQCPKCKFIYDPAKNNNVSFQDLPDTWKCPKCGEPKGKFKPME